MRCVRNQSFQNDFCSDIRCHKTLLATRAFRDPIDQSSVARIMRLMIATQGSQSERHMDQAN